VSRLAIHAHGLAGKFFIDGKNADPLTKDNIAARHKDLEDIGLATTPDATILLVGCLAGQRKEGTQLLQALSGVWPGRTVVGFVSVGYVHGGNMWRSGLLTDCIEPGMRDTDHLYPSLSAKQQEDYGKIWGDLTKLPWASENSPHAKIVKDGVVLRGEGW
jgi:hypothetical protein